MTEARAHQGPGGPPRTDEAAEPSPTSAHGLPVVGPVGPESSVARRGRASPAPAEPLRVGFDARYVDDRYHGIGRYAYQVLEALTRLFPDDRFAVYHNPGRPSTRLDLGAILARPNVEPRALPHDIYSPLEQPALALAALRPRLDVFYTPYFSAPLLAPAPVVVTVHDLIFDREPRYRSGRWVRYYYRPMMRLSPRKAAWVVAVSAATAADLRAFYGVPAGKVAVIPEAAGPQFQPVTDEGTLRAVRARYALPERYLLALGVRRPHKNLPALLEAFALARERIPHDLVLVGEAHARYADAVPATIDRLGLGARVRLVGHAPDADLPALYTLADLFVLPSLLEGFGLPALEAMGCGTPVVAARTSSLPEVVGEAGLLADPRDPEALAAAVIAAVTDRERHARLRALGLARAREFSWERTATALRGVLAEAAGR